MYLVDELKNVPGRVIESREKVFDIDVDVFMWYMEGVRNVVIKTRMHVITGVPETITDGWFNYYSDRFDESELYTCDAYLISGIHINELRENNDALKGLDCAYCRGTGEYDSEETCESCGGSGADGGGMTCWTCDGNGNIIYENDMCPDCDGTGFDYFGEIRYESLVHNKDEGLSKWI